MRGKLEVLFGGVLLASAMVLAGCVAQTADDSDDEALDEASASLVVEQVSGGDRGTPAATPRRQDSEAAAEDMAGSFKGNDCTTDPQPNPWVPMTPAPPPSDPGPNKNARQTR